MTSGTRGQHQPPERVVSTPPGTNHPVVRYRVLLHARPTAHTTQVRPEAPRTDRTRRCDAADLPITTRMSWLVMAVLVTYVTAMVAAFGIAAGAVVVGIGGVVLVAARGRGLR